MKARFIQTLWQTTTLFAWLQIAGPSVAVDGPQVSIVNPGVTFFSTPTPQFSFSVDGGSPPFTTTCRVDSDVFAVCSSPFQTQPLLDGAHSLDVRATDSLDSVGQDTLSFDIDTIAPDVIGLTGPAFSNIANPSVTWTVTPGGSPVQSFCQVDAGGYGPCSSPYAPPPLTEGPHSISVYASDAAGNVGSPAEIQVVIDTIAPTITFFSAPADPISDPTPSFIFSVSTGGSPVSISCAIDAGGFEPCLSPYNTKPLLDGPHTLHIALNDLAGNSGMFQHEFLIDTITIFIDGFEAPE